MADFKDFDGQIVEASLRATTSSDGLMSSTDKAKLDGIATGATNAYLAINNTESKSVGRLQYFQVSNNTTLMPDSGWWSLIRTQHQGYTSGYWQEMAYAFSSDTIKFRRNVNGTLSSWKTLAFTDSSITGNAASATKLQTARTLTIGSTGKTFDGNANVSWSLTEIGAAAASHTHNYAGSSSAGGAATSATKLATARTINGTNFDGTAAITTTNWGTARTITIGSTGKSVNGSANVSWSLSEIGAATASHTHNSLMYTDLSSLTVSLNTYNLSSGTPKVAYYYCPTDGNGANITGRPDDNNKTAFNLKVELIRYNGSTDYISKQTYIRGAEKVVYERYCTNGTWGAWSKVYTSTNKPTPADIGAAASSHTHNYAGSSSAGGAANSATVLATARTINGTSFNGSANITTANWGTARTITIGSTGKSVNGSANVSWSLTEIGAAAASHTHNYAGSSSAGGSANTAVKLATARTITIGSGSMSFDGSANISISHNSIGVGKVANSAGIGGTQAGKTTAEFVSILSSLGAFNQQYWVTRGSWSYAANIYITDTGFGNLHLAGCVVEVFSAGTGAYTIRITAPTTSSSGGHNGDYIYINNGSSYSPGWRKLYSSSNKPTPADIGAASSSHTHNYAGSSSAGGAANSAVKATQDSAGQQINTTYIKGLSVSGRTITYTKGDGTTGTITTQDTNTTYSNMKGATTSAAGAAGLVPAPTAGAATRYLRSDGTWQVPPNTTYSVATTSANGLMSSTDKTNLTNLLTRVSTLESNYNTMLAKLKTAVFIKQ